MNRLEDVRQTGVVPSPEMREGGKTNYKSTENKEPFISTVRTLFNDNSLPRIEGDGWAGTNFLNFRRQAPNN